MIELHLSTKDGSLRNLILGAALFIGSGLATAAHVTARTEMRATEEVCALIQANYYRSNEPDVRQFLKNCETDDIPFTFTRAKAIRNINRRLSQIQSSHLSVYAPSETLRLWENEGSDTGLRSRLIDGELIITGTLPESPARRADLRAGDAIISINDEPASSDLEAQSTAGFYKVARGSKIFQVNLQLEDLKEDLSPSIVTLKPNGSAAKPNGVLRIPSFLPQYFEHETWLPLTAQLSKYQNMIVDLRGNAGGSFPAMLRALTPFRCESTAIGYLWRAPRDGALAKVELVDDLNATRQVEMLEVADSIELKPFAVDEKKPGASVRYPCYQGDVVVLVDNNTASVSEIFAEAMLARPNTKVWGWLTSGQVVMARWFSIGSFGGGDYAISIPVAGYRTSGGKPLERDGVAPQKELRYDLETALKGDDSWIDSAAKSFTK